MKVILNKKVEFCGLCILLFLICGVATATCQQREADIKDMRVTVRMEKVPFGMVLGYLMEAYDVPMGFEESILDRDQSVRKFSVNAPGIAPYKMENVGGILTSRMEDQREFNSSAHPISIDRENERLEEVLNQIVKQMENYRWEIDDGVVNILPIRGRDERFAKLLGLTVRRFTLDKGSTVRDITTNLKLLPEFSEFLRKNNLEFTGARTGPEGPLKREYGRRLGQGMDFSNLTLRELLNRITKIKRGGWVLRWKWTSEATGEERIDIDI